jgi:conjugative transposon TraK protein
MFKSLQNLDSAFRQTRVLFIIFATATTLVSIFVTYSAYRFSQKAREKIYVLDSNKSLILALSQETKQNIPAQLRGHIKRFHELFFTLAPDQKAITYTMTQALYLCDESAAREYNNLREAGFYNNMIAGSVTQEIKVDSIQLDLEKYPYTAKTFATQTITRSTAITTRTLISECNIRNVTGSDNNPFGFIMERWRVLQNTDLKTQER